MQILVGMRCNSVRKEIILGDGCTETDVQRVNRSNRQTDGWTDRSYEFLYGETVCNSPASFLYFLSIGDPPLFGEDVPG